MLISEMLISVSPQKVRKNSANVRCKPINSSRLMLS